MTALPWLSLIKVAAVLAALSLAGAWVHGMGQRSGLRDGLEAGETERMRLAARVTHTQAELAACGTTLGEVNAATARDLAEAQQRARAGERAAAEAAAAAAAAETERLDLAAALAGARRAPACLAQLEVRLCDAIPLL